MRHFQGNGDGVCFTGRKINLCKIMLKSKYNNWKGLCGGDVSGGTLFWWQDLMRVCGSKSGTKWFDNSFEWKLGVGDKTKF